MNLIEQQLKELLPLEGFYIYHLRRIDKWYVGETNNLLRRTKQHIEGSNVLEIAEEYNNFPETVHFLYTYIPDSTKAERLDQEDIWKEKLKQKYGWSNLLNKCDFREDFSVVRPVIQLNYRGEFLARYDSGVSASRKLGLDKGGLYRALNNPCKLGGYIWMYETDYSPKAAREKIEDINSSPGTQKVVHAFDLEGKWVMAFATAREAGRVLGIQRSHITKCCKGNHKTVGGYKWVYDFNLTDVPLVDLHKHGKILQVDRKTGNIIDRYETVKEAAQSVNGQPGDISKVLNDNRNTASGYNWRYLEEGEDIV